jgi:AbrB family looped-hinge helix DNA binding protein
MKALGIVRRIDNLGRIVLPKEVRDTNGWEAGTPIEMFSTEEGMLIKPYGVDQEKKIIINQVLEVLEHTHNEVSKKALLDTINFIKKG